ncbi:MAG: hypothetical protein ACRERU_11900 [Methylococcales bacterium]
MINGRSFNLFAASILARAPNFVLPIFVARVLDFPAYSLFAVAFATASASSAFLGEAIAATISRESYRVKQEEAGSASLGAFYRTSTLAAFGLIGFGVLLYHDLISTGAGGIGPKLTLATATLLLIPAYLLPQATAALANARGLGRISVKASLIGIPIAIGASLALGAKFGVTYFLITYAVFTLLTNLYVYVRVSHASLIQRKHVRAGVLSGYGSTFFFILAPFLLGGPVHGLCLAILGYQESGVEEVARFVAYYPWTMAVSVFSAVLGNYVVQTAVEVERNNDPVHLRTFLLRLLAGNLALAILISACLWFGLDFALALYGSTIARDQTLFGWMLMTGIAAACVNTTSQIIIATGRGRGLLMASILHATMYICLTALFVGFSALGAIGLIQSLCYSLFLLAVTQLTLIALRVQRSEQECAGFDRTPF